MLHFTQAFLTLRDHRTKVKNVHSTPGRYSDDLNMQLW